MRAALAACVLALVANSASAQFELDISSRDFNRMFGESSISDLAVGERGYVYSWAVCAEDGKLFAMGDVTLLEPTTIGSHLLIRRLPDRKVEISIFVGSEVSNPIEERDSVIRTIANAFACAASRAWRENLELLQIQKIDGHETLSELVTSQR